MPDSSKLALSSTASSLKVLKGGSGAISLSTFSDPSGFGEVYKTDTIPHNFGSDDLLFQVSVNGVANEGIMAPWKSNDGRVIIYAHIDSTNLYITINENDSSGSGGGGGSFTYYYRILIP